MTDAQPTGNPRVDAALAELDRIATLPPADQVAGFAAVHRELQETLADIDRAAVESGPAPAPPGPRPPGTGVGSFGPAPGSRPGSVGPGPGHGS